MRSHEYIAALVEDIQADTAYTARTWEELTDGERNAYEANAAWERDHNPAGRQPASFTGRELYRRATATPPARHSR